MGKNIQKVQDMLDGNHKNKIQVGYSTSEETRNVGDKWTDSEGYEWEQREGFKIKHGGSMVAKGIADTCPDCKSLVLKPWDKDSYKSNGRCYYCQIDFEAKFSRKLDGKKEDIIRQFTGEEGIKRWEKLSEEEKESVMDNILDDKEKYVLERLIKYVEGFKKEEEIWKKENDEEKVFDKSVANALANDNIDTNNVKLTNNTK